MSHCWEPGQGWAVSLYTRQSVGSSHSPHLPQQQEVGTSQREAVRREQGHHKARCHVSLNSHTRGGGAFGAARGGVRPGNCSGMGAGREGGRVEGGGCEGRAPNVPGCGTGGGVHVEPSAGRLHGKERQMTTKPWPALGTVLPVRFHAWYLSSPPLPPPCSPMPPSL